MKIDLSTFTPYDKNADNCLPDMYCVLVVTEKMFGTEPIRFLHVAIHVFNDQKFISNCEFLDNVIAYTEYQLIN